MSFQSFARGIDVGAHCYLLEAGGARMVLDAGTHPKYDGSETLPILDRLHYDSADAILLSHAHLDHIGALPILSRRLPSAPILATEETLVIGEALLHNSVNVMTAQRRELGIVDYPLYTHGELDDLAERWIPRSFGSPFPVKADGPVSATFLPAGHVLGAAAVAIRHGDRVILYSGDLHFEDQSLCLGADLSSLEGERIDTLIVETTRGDSGRDSAYSRASETARLLAAILETIGQGGSVLLPVFAFGKTQELLALLHNAIDAGQMPGIPVHIGGLGTKITSLFDRLSERSRRALPGFRFLEDFPDLSRPSRREPEPSFAPGRIYALSSGMMSENTVSNRFARHILSDPRSAVLFIGYADPDSPAGRILSARPGERVSMNDRGSGRELRVDCRVEKFDFSGHAPREQVLDYLVHQNPRHTLLIHGDESARQWFAGQLATLRPEMRVTIPAPGIPVDL